MLTVSKVSYGINTMVIGTISVTTLKLKVANSFPFSKLPKEVRTSPAKGNCTILLYCALNTSESNEIVASVGRLLKEHALNKLNAKYDWCAPMEEYAYRPTFDNAELPW